MVLHLHSFLKQIKQHEKKFILFFLCFFLISLPFIIWQQHEQYKSYLFFTVAPKDVSYKVELKQDINSLYLISSSDLFAETIIGWFKNPAFLEDIEKYSISPLPRINVRKESKQNVMIFFTTTNSQSNDLLLLRIRQKIEQSVIDYNMASSTQYSLVNLGTKTYTITPNIIFDISISLIGSMLISALMILLFPMKVKITRR